MTNAETCDLATKTCKPCEGGVLPMEQAEVDRLLREIRNWEQAEKGIARVFKFNNHYETMAFVNAVAWISHHEDHHPDLEVGYSHCRVSYVTHAIGGLSENDFICAAKVDRLLNL